MLLLYQTGTVKIGEVVRYTVTYTPSHDRILPSPSTLHLRIRNASAIALRAAFVHGPYNLSVAAYPSQFNPNERFVDKASLYGVPEYEPMLKPGGTWSVQLVVPEYLRQGAGAGDSGVFGEGKGEGESVSWIIEVASQVLFSTSAAVSYEVLLARDEKSLTLSSGIPVVGGGAQVPQPGKVSDWCGPQQRPSSRHGHNARGVFSRAVRLRVEDTAALWNKPALPEAEEGRIIKEAAPGSLPGVRRPSKSQGDAERPAKRQKKVHLVILTHGLHSNLGGDMLYMKESIDAGVRQAKIDARERKAREHEEHRSREPHSGVPSKDGTENTESEVVEEDEEVIVRGFAGNATRTERGIKYLGKRLARYVLSMTYPDQPVLPAGKAAHEAMSHPLQGHLETPPKKDTEGSHAVHRHSTAHKQRGAAAKSDELPYRITKISFIAHSLGGLVQTYAVAYIQKHSPQFFDLIEPINFVALASPFLGLNHENPVYVNFALDFGLVGRTGQDLGLTWRAPTIARSGWGSIVSTFGENAHKRVMGESQPESKPLLRILPTGPAHVALQKFRNRTVYSNVVNDGIVPLRTSCLLFLDWQGLGRVERARREAGLVETIVRTGWAEMTGTNVLSARSALWAPNGDGASATSSAPQSPGLNLENSHQVPQPATDAVMEDDRQSIRPVATPAHEDVSDRAPSSYASTNSTHPFSGFFNLFRNNDPPKPPTPPSQKQRKIFERSQTLKVSSNPEQRPDSAPKSKVTTGDDLTEDIDSVSSAPPRTTFFESAGDILNPKMASVDFLIDPSSRPRTIFHDRVYHPSDIPPPPMKPRPSFGRVLSFHKSGNVTTPPRSASGTDSPYPQPGVNHQDSMASAADYDDTAQTNPDKIPGEVIDTSALKVEEKIARAYHKGLSWRKVLVKLEPDAHNNIIVRRQFANAFGWPVVKHLVDAHFSDAVAARTRDEAESSRERALGENQGPDRQGNETQTQNDSKGQAETEASKTARSQESDADARPRSASYFNERQEARDDVADLPSTPDATAASQRHMHSATTPRHPHSHSHVKPPLERGDSMTWSERDWADSADEHSDMEDHMHTQPGKADASQIKASDLHQSQADQSQSPARSSSPLGAAWNWTEKIVGRSRSTSSKVEKLAAGDQQDGALSSPTGPGDID